MPFHSLVRISCYMFLGHLDLVYRIHLGHISDGVWEAVPVSSMDFAVLGLVSVKASAHLRLFEIACLTRLITMYYY
jgi:hypothetical protein